MKKLYPITVLLLALSFSGAALANADSGGKEGKPSFMEDVASRLPAQDAASFRTTMRRAYEQNKAMADQIHALHDDLDYIMAAEPFEVDAFRAKSAKLREIYEQMRANTDEAFASAASQLSQSERETVAVAMAYPHKKHGAPSASH